jgi:hypothetical protein
MIDQHEPGAKLDDGKVRVGLVLGAFANALTEVCKVGTFGAKKYTDNGWLEVPNGIERYTDAMLRHWLAEQTGEWLDQESELLHAAHLAWNALARLELILREQPQVTLELELQLPEQPWDVPPGTRVGQYPAPSEPED